MPNVVRVGDQNTAGGVALQGASTVFADGSSVVLPGSPVTPHGCCGLPGCSAHCAAQTQGGSSTVFIEGKPVVLSTDIDTCGHSRQTFGPTVFVGA